MVHPDDAVSTGAVGVLKADSHPGWPHPVGPAELHVQGFANLRDVEHNLRQQRRRSVQLQPVHRQPPGVPWLGDRGSQACVVLVCVLLE